MLVRLKQHADTELVRRRLHGMGVWTVPANTTAGVTAALRIAPHSAKLDRAIIEALDGVDDVLVAPSSHPLVDAQAGRPLRVAGVDIGCGAPPVLMAGPCSIESREHAMDAAERVAKSGARFLRGGAFKPRSSPYSFSGVGLEGLAWMREAADAHGLGVVTEAMSEAHVEQVAAHADIIQIGSRNMQNFALLAAVGQATAGKARKHVLLKRGMAATVEDWLMAGEHLLAAGAAGVVFCERGIVGFDSSTRNLLDLGAVALLSHVHRQPVIVDPSHAVGRIDLIAPLSTAAIAAGAHGLLIETHAARGAAKSDGPQALTPEQLAKVANAMPRGPS